MTYVFGLAPIVAGVYLAYSLAMLKQVKLPIFSGQDRRFLNGFSYFVFALTVALFLYFVYSKDLNEMLVSFALCITAFVAILQFRVTIGDNGVFAKVQFHPWTDFQGFRWRKNMDRSYWILFLYKAHSVDIFSVSIPEKQVSRLDLILQNKIGMVYHERS
ncbi:MAG: hypothetical protein ACE5HO_21135 [bacterium]